MTQQIGLSAIFNGCTVSGYYEHAYEDNMMIIDGTCSRETSSSSGVNWDLDMSALAADRGYPTAAPMYDC